MWAAGCLVLIAAAFVLGLRVRSPWEQSIDNARSQPVVTARAEVRTLTVQDAPITGIVSLGTEQPVRTAGDTPAVVTAAHAAPGDVLLPGEVAIEVSGRPIVALALPFPMYRTLVPGDEGPDVRAVQQALTDLSFYRGVLDGKYGTSTARAVAQLYRGVKLSEPQPAEGAAAAVEAAESVLADAQAAEPVDEATVKGAREELLAAQAAAATPLPLAEVVPVPVEGAAVVSVAPVGATLADDAPAVILRAGSAVVTARVGVDQVDGLALGTSVTVVSVLDSSTSTVATVTSIGPFAASGDDDALPGNDVVFTLAPGAQLAGGAQVSVVVEGAAAELQGLTVPLVSVREDSSGSFVLRVAHEGAESSEHVAVVVTATGDGFAFVEPGGLVEGDVVVVAQPE